jgi:hypothetical protein
MRTLAIDETDLVAAGMIGSNRPDELSQQSTPGTDSGGGGGFESSDDPFGGQLGGYGMGLGEITPQTRYTITSRDVGCAAAVAGVGLSIATGQAAAAGIAFVGALATCNP